MGISFHANTYKISSYHTKYNESANLRIAYIYMRFFWWHKLVTYFFNKNDNLGVTVIKMVIPSPSVKERSQCKQGLVVYYPSVGMWSSLK